MRREGNEQEKLVRVIKWEGSEGKGREVVGSGGRELGGRQMVKYRLSRGTRGD